MKKEGFETFEVNNEDQEELVAERKEKESPEDFESDFNLNKILSEADPSMDWNKFRKEKGDISKEFAIAVFHPELGRGQRDERGKLRVWWPERGEMRPISYGWLREISKAWGVPNLLGDRPREALVDRASKLVSSGLVRPEDFQQLSGGRTNERFRTRKEIKKNGTFMIDGVRYYVGKGPEWKDSEVIELDEKRLAIIRRDEDSGSYEVTHVFDKLEPGDERLAPVFKSGTDNKVLYYRTSKRGDNIFSLDSSNVEDFIGPSDSPDQEAREERMKLVELTEEILSLSGRLSLEAGINLGKLSTEEQIRLAEISKDESRFKDMLTFAKRFGIDGLRIYASLGSETDSAERIEDFTREYGEQVAKEVFSRHSEILDSVEESVAEINLEEEDEYFKKRLEARVRENLSKRANRLLRKSIESSGVGIRELLKDLDVVEIENEAFLSAFISLKKEGRDFAFEDMEKTSFSSKEASELDERELSQMKDLYSGNLDLATKQKKEGLLAYFNEMIDEGDARFYIFKYDGKIRGFMAFKENEDSSVSGGAFNVDREFSGASIGEEMMRRALDIEAREHKIIASCNARARVASFYIEKNKHVGIGFEEETEESYPVLKIMRDDRAEYFYKDSSADEIISMYENAPEEEGSIERRVEKGVIIAASSVEDLMPLWRTNKDMILTRYFFEDSKGERKLYAVFEPSSGSESR